MPSPEREALEINRQLTIPAEELQFEHTRSSGPGGQNVNKVATRVTLRFDVALSPSLTATQRGRIRAELATRISRDGLLRVVSSKHRTQGMNREAAVERFVELLREALAPRTPRIPTRMPASARRRRRTEKAQRSERKRQRGERFNTDG